MIGWLSDTLAKRLFLLMSVALVGSHLVAFVVVGAVYRPPSAPGAPSGGLPTFPSLPPTPGIPELPSTYPREGKPPGRGPPFGAPGPRQGGGGFGAPSMPWDALLLDYVVRFAVMAVAAWFGSRWLAEPMRRLVDASRSMTRSVSGAPSGPLLDDHHGTREVREAAGVFNEMARALTQQFRARGLMVAAISHDLRTPLTRLRMRLENDSRMTPAVQQRAAKDIHEMSDLIDKVLGVFRLDGASDSDPICALDVDSLLQSMVDDRVEQGQPVSYRGGPAVTQARAASLRRIIDNLVDNALRYGERADLLLQVTKNELRLTVSDAGPGIPPAQLEAVFEPFYRIDASRNRETGGTGLGLYIARELMQQQGGTLALENLPGGGLQARLAWPVRR